MTPLRIELDRSSPIPLYHQIASSIEAAIDRGDLVAGSRIETELSLAARLGISRPTARQALQELVEKGLLVRRRGVGTQVAYSQIRRPVELTSLNEDLTTSGRTPRTQILEYVTGSADAGLAQILSLPEGAPVVTIRRLRFADDEPLALMTNHLAAALAPDEATLAELGLYAALRTHGIQLHVAQQRIGARIATAKEARQLGEPPRAALLTMERTAFDDAGRTIEHGSHVYRASRYVFDTTLFAR